MEPRESRASGAGRLVFAAIAPHGEYAIPEACPPETPDLAIATQRAMVELALRFDRSRPEAVIVLTPHGLHVSGRFAVVTAGRVAGALEEAPAIRLELPVDRPLALALVDALGQAGLPASAVSFGGNVPDEAVMPLDWGSLVPLWYLGGRHDPPVPVVVVAPARELSAQAHVEAGRVLAEAVAASGRRVALVASADQAHAHSARGPYGYDPAAATFDELAVRAVRDGRLSDLAELPPALIEAAKPDSWWQMLMLFGAIGDAWLPTLLSYEVPTYFGMLCAAFAPPAEEPA